jgi:alcohol dehydrogenase YqhD (iron-dependent ADH family)
MCAGINTLLVIIYQGHSPSLVRARSQEEIEAIFAGTLCYNGLTSAGQQSDWCLL